MGDFLSSIILGAISKGVNKPTVIFVNGALCLSTVLVLGSLSLSGLPEDLTFHLSILLSLMIGLLVAFNWFLSQIGIESIEEQKDNFKSIQS